MLYKHRFTIEIDVKLSTFGDDDEEIPVPPDVKDRVFDMYKDNAELTGQLEQIDIIEVSWNDDNTIKIVFERDLDRVLELDEDEEDILSETEEYNYLLKTDVDLLSDPDDDGNYPINWGSIPGVLEKKYYVKGYSDHTMAKIELIGGIDNTDTDSDSDITDSDADDE